MIPTPRTLSRGALVALLLPLLVRPVASSPNNEAFLYDVQRRTFRWFWETTNPENGLVPDRAPSPPFSSIASIGFALTAYGVGVERGYITRAEAVERTLVTLRFLAQAPQGEEETGISGYRGFFYHFLEMDTGVRYKRNELSSIDTALLMLGALFAREYFDRDEPPETEIRRLSDHLYRRVEWNWLQPRAPLIAMSWYPERGFGRSDYKGFDEAMFLYVLALGSPTHPAKGDAWEAFTRTYHWGEFHGQEYIQFTPLFGYQYSHVWIDPRGLQDAYVREKGIDYFENARRATYANRAYCIDNPGRFLGYGENLWGLTACDGPGAIRVRIDGRPVRFYGYTARGASLRRITDDGTITPTAPGGSVPFAPEITIPALREMRDRYGELVYNDYGFVDAFNPTFRSEYGAIQRGIVHPEHGWFDDQHLGIDQGPILLMIENHRTGFVWEVMKRSPYIRAGLLAAGFTADWLKP